MILAVLDAGLVRRRPSQMLMAPVASEPAIWRMVQRVRLARTLTKLVVATSSDASDDALTGYLTEHGVSVFRGDSQDVLGSLARCVRASGAGHVAFVDADTPLIDPGLIDEAVRYALASRSDMVSSIAYPQGLAVTVANDVAVMQVEASATAEDALCHPCDLIFDQPQRFQIANFRARRDWSALDWRADTPTGFIAARRAFEHLYAENSGFDVEDVLAYLADQAAEQQAIRAA